MAPTNQSIAEMIWDIPNEVNIPMTMGHYLRSMETLTNRITATSYRDPKRQRLYMKDIDCPETWFNHLKEVMPASVFYFNDCIEPRTGGDGAIREPNEYGQMVYGKGVAPAGDLMSSLPPEMRALNMMCYIGHEGTYTPAHREMCASLGHNIMVEASQNRKGEQAGSSIWFMTETKEREVVSEYFLSMLGHDIEVEKHFAQLNAWKKAPFNVWVVEQKVGDLILIPPLAPHQVWNRGTRTMKAAWNRTTVDTLELALHEALPRARMVCREEQYKNKAIVYYTLGKYYDLIRRDTVEPKMWKYGRIKQVLDDFKRLFALYGEILVSEMFSPKLPEEEDVEYIEYDSNITCSYCRGNIFNRFLTCKSCVQTAGEIEDTYDVCMDCYAMGRSCACISNLSWVEQWDWRTLVQNYEKWRALVIQFDGFFDKYRSPQPLDIARKQYRRKPVAEVCQEQLRIRPWKDITQVDKEPTPESESEPEVDDEGRVKKKRKKSARMLARKVVPTKNKTSSCHICFHHELNWKLAFCTTCSTAYCYGTLWRAFDMMPQTVMEDKEWSCPRCLKICSCGKCRKDPRQVPYAPKGTLLGHDTKKVADYRSVESLVDFAKPNVTWLREENETDPQETARMKRLRAQADAEKDQELMDGETGYQEGEGNGAYNSHNGRDAFGAENDPFTVGERSPAEPHEQHRGDHAELDTALNCQAHLSALPADSSLSADWSGHEDEENTIGDAQAGYPDTLLAQGLIDPSLIRANRLMGAGYYQQGSGTDRILFDAPEETVQVEETQTRDPKKNPNFLFSDLIDPALQSEEVKKRRRAAEEEEEEFFLSKKQRRAAREKQIMFDYGIEDDPSESPQHGQRQPRRSTSTMTYLDLGEDAVPVEDDEAVTTYKPKAEHLSDNMNLAAKTLSRFSNRTSVENSDKKRIGRPKGSVNKNSPKAAARNTISTPRKSAWLTRKEAANNGTDVPTESRPFRCPRSALSNVENASETINIPSAENSDDDDAIYNKTDSNDEVNNSLVEEPSGRSRQQSEELPDLHDLFAGNSAVSASRSVAPTANMSTAKPAGTPNPAPRKRGRPRKNPPVPTQSTLKSPAHTSTQMLSLKERLALKGRNAKIVSKPDTSAPSPIDSPRSSATPSTQLKSILKIGSVSGANDAESDVLATGTPVWSKFAAEDNEDVNDAHNDFDDNNTQNEQLPVRNGVTFESLPSKGPTVVRLMSPTPDDSDNEQVKSTRSKSRSKSYSSDSDDNSGSDVSIPAARPSAISGRGAPSSRGFGGMRGGMPAKRGKGRPPGSKNRA